MSYSTNNLTPITNLSGSTDLVVSTNYQSLGRVTIASFVEYLRKLSTSPLADFSVQTYAPVNGNTISPKLQEWSALSPITNLNTLTIQFPSGASQGSKVRFSSQLIVQQYNLSASLGDYVIASVNQTSNQQVFTFEYCVNLKTWFLV